MLLRSLTGVIFLYLSALLAFARSSRPHSRLPRTLQKANLFRGKQLCGSVITDADRLHEAEFQALRKALVKSRQIDEGTNTIYTPFNIDIYFHVVHRDRTSDGGYVSDSQITSQISTLNDKYKTAALSFTLKAITRTQNARWFNDANKGNAVDVDMKNMLHEGDEKTLNLFSIGFVGQGGEDEIGYSTKPWEVKGTPKLDAIEVRYDTLPGGSLPNLNLGITAVHEVGHWLGLHHTFEGGCVEPGDYVDDTPPERSPNYGCPASRDTCEDLEGPDPIFNYMDYTDDRCMNNFTPGQIARLREQIHIYRKIPM